MIRIIPDQRVVYRANSVSIVAGNIARMDFYDYVGFNSKSAKYALALCSKKELAIEFSKYCTHPGENGNIYFSNEVSYPRYKMKDVPYKTVHDPSEADYVVYNNNMVLDKFSLYPSDHIIVFSCCGIYYMFGENALDQYLSHHGSKYYPDIVTESLLKQVMLEYNRSKIGNNAKKLLLGDIDFIYIGEVVKIGYKDIEMFQKTFSGEYTNLVKLSEFDKKVCQYLPKYDFQSLDGIEEMIQSSDTNTSEIGWKSLLSMDTSNYPNVTRYFLYMYSYFLPNSLKNSVGFQSTIRSLGVDLYHIGVGTYLNDLQNFTISEQELPCVEYLVSKMIKRANSKVIDDLNTQIAFLNMSVELKFNGDF